MKVTNIAKNTSYYTLALIIQKVISFSYFAILARTLVPDDLGKFYFAISFTTIFAIFIDLGLANVLTRETAKDQTKSSDLISTILAVKIPLGLISMATVVILIHLMGYEGISRDLVYISSISMILDSFTLSFFAVLRGHHNLGYESIASIIFQAIVMIFGLLALKLDYSLRWVMSAQALASIFNFTYSLSLVKFKFKISIMPRWNMSAIQSLFIIALPFTIYAVFQRLFTYLDTVFLSMLAGDEAVGIYQVAFKIILALQFLPMAFVASLYPAFSSYWKNNKEQLAVTFERAINYLAIISLPISLGIMTIADRIIMIFRPEYVKAIIPLQIIVSALPFMFLNYPVGSLLNACDKQKRNTINMGITLVFSIMLNIYLIPKYHEIGAGLTVLICNIIMFSLGMITVPKIVNYNPQKILNMLIKVVLSTALMSFVVMYLKIRISIYLTIILGAITYATMMYLTGGIDKSDIKSIVQSFKKTK